jgi:hypothetical protein
MQMLFRDYDSVLLIAASEGHVRLATLAIDLMVADAEVRLERRHW